MVFLSLSLYTVHLFVVLYMHICRVTRTNLLVGKLACTWLILLHCLLLTRHLLYVPSTFSVTLFDIHYYIGCFCHFIGFTLIRCLITLHFLLLAYYIIYTYTHFALRPYLVYIATLYSNTSDFTSLYFLLPHPVICMYITPLCPATSNLYSLHFPLLPHYVIYIS